MTVKIYTMRDLVEILADYDLVHMSFPGLNEGNGRVIGFADDYNKRISINGEASTAERRTAVVHELYHVYHFLEGDLDNASRKKTEQVVDVETKQMMKILYKPESREK